jgi:neutral ceramidase
MRAVLICAIFCAWVALARAETNRQFRAGAAASNVTPWLGLSINGGFQDHIATNVHDELHARCLVLDDSQSRLALVVVDSCMIPREIFDEAKRLASQDTGIPVSNMMMSATHTHSAPAATPVFQSDPDADYRKFLARRIADGVWRAANNLAPAKIAWGTASVPEQVFNRRWFMKPGAVLRDPFNRTNDQVKMNPGVGNAFLLDPAGPTDPEVVFISLQHTNGKPLALLANYSLHYCGGCGPGVISADYFGMFADRIQQLLGADRQDPPFVGVMANGTSGNINNINFRGGQPKQPPFGQMRMVANAVAEAVHREHQNVRFRDWVPLKALQTELTLGVRKPTPREVEFAESVLAKASSKLVTPEEVYARETALIKDYPETVALILQAVRIGDVGIAAIPCEVFVEIGLDFKRQSRALGITPSFTVSLANGYNGYLPTVEHFKLGGYETWRARSSYLETNAAPQIYKTVTTLLEKLR